MKRSFKIVLIVSLVMNGLLIALAVIGWYNLTPIGTVLNEQRGGAIFTVPDQRAWLTVAHVFDSLGDPPRHSTENPDVQRAFMQNGDIINLPSPELLERLGHDIVASRYFVVDDPESEGRRIVAYLKSQGYEASLIMNAERNLNVGAMGFVTSNAFPHLAIVLRKWGPDMGEPLTSWDWDRHPR